jgi:hypothetical protein
VDKPLDDDDDDDDDDDFTWYRQRTGKFSALDLASTPL